MSELKAIECEGSHREMGEAQGRACADQLGRLDEALAELMAAGGGGPLAKTTQFLSPVLAGGMALIGGKLLSGALEDNYPDQHARIGGIAAGSGVPERKLYVGPAIELLLNRIAPTKACTAVAVSRDRSANGEPMIAKNFDYPRAALDHYIARFSRPNDLAQSIDVTAAPLAGSHEGINEYGLAVAYNYGHFSGKPEARVAITTLVQEVLEHCDSVDGAIEHLKRRPRAGGALLMLADGGGNIASIEISPDSVGVRVGRDCGDFLVHGNHAVTEEMQGRDVPRDARYPGWWRPKEMAGTRFHASSESRHSRAEALIEEAGAISEDTLRAIVGDHGREGLGSDLTICRHGPYYATTCSVLLFPRRREMKLMFGSPCSSEFVTLSLEGGGQIASQGDVMKTYTGTVKKNDLEGGFWELHTDDGERYQLRGAANDLLVEGTRAKVSGAVDGGGFGIGMTGAYLDVDSWSAA